MLSCIEKFVDCIMYHCMHKVQIHDSFVRHASWWQEVLFSIKYTWQFFDIAELYSNFDLQATDANELSTLLSDDSSGDENRLYFHKRLEFYLFYVHITGNVTIVTVIEQWGRRGLDNVTLPIGKGVISAIKYFSLPTFFLVGVPFKMTFLYGEMFPKEKFYILHCSCILIQILLPGCWCY